MEYPFSMQMVSFSRRTALVLPQKFRNFRSQSRLTAFQMMWLWIWALSMWVQTIKALFPLVNLRASSWPSRFASSGVISPGTKDWRRW